MTALGSGWMRAGAASGILVLAGLGGCATLGGNIKGSFSCQAPDGICAPSSSIDDHALAMISGDAGDVMVPAGPYREPQAQPGKPRATRIATVAGSRAAPRDQAPRTSEKVLRIVFQPYVDERGRLHEASAVHAVVQRGEWQEQAQREATPLPDRKGLAAAITGPSLSDAIDSAESSVGFATIDPNLPDPAVVAQARARRAAPVRAIHADVASRLPAPKSGAPVARRVPAAGQIPTPAASAAIAPLVRPPAASQPTAVAVARTASPAQGGTVITLATPAKTQPGVQAVDQVKASDAYRAAGTQAESSARAAAAASPALSGAPTIRAAVEAGGFPAAVPEDE